VAGSGAYSAATRRAAASLQSSSLAPDRLSARGFLPSKVFVQYRGCDRIQAYSPKSAPFFVPAEVLATTLSA
jgi:hypothetical protein